MRMKTSLAAFLVIAAILFQAQGSLGSPLRSVCCFSFLSKAIPKSLLLSYDYTSPECATRAVVFTTKRGIKLCADPSVQWTQDVIHYLEQKIAPSTSP